MWQKICTLILFLFLLFGGQPYLFCQNEKNEGIEIKKEDLEKINIIELSSKDVHDRMLEKLNLQDSHQNQSFFRRGEITFFISFGYLWMYQFILYDQLLSGSFSETNMDGELTDRNLYFAVITSLVLALFVARNDLQHTYYLEKGHFFKYQKAFSNPVFDRTKKSYNWYFDFFSWKF